jgi:hypothetical protein
VELDLVGVELIHRTEELLQPRNLLTWVRLREEPLDLLIPGGEVAVTQQRYQLVLGPTGLEAVLPS